MEHHTSHDAPRKIARGKWVLVGFLIVAAYFLWTEHRAHTISALPYLLLLACPLMHLFHHGHGHHSHAQSPDQGAQRRDGEPS